MIDHIAVPGNWIDYCAHSTVIEDFDLANIHEDHKATALQLQWTTTTTWKRDRSPKDISYVDSPNMPDRIRAYSCLPWHTETQANHVTEHLHQALRYQHTDGHTKAKKAYITDDIWEIRNNKIKYKKKIKDIARRIKFDTLAFFFKAWHDPEQSTHLLECRFYDATMRCAMFKYKICLKKVRFQLKKSLTAAKQRRLEEELQSLTPSTSAPTVLNKLKSFVGPTNPKKKNKSHFL